MLASLQGAAALLWAGADSLFKGCCSTMHYCIIFTLTLLQSVVKQWRNYSAEQQRELFDAALMTASKQAWDDLEDDLQLALDLAAA